MSQDQIKQTISSNIKELRRINGLTQDDLSKVIGVNRSKVGAWEEGRALPLYNDLIRVADFFGKDLRVFMTHKIDCGGLM